MPVRNLSNGTIDDIARDRNSTLVTITYLCCPGRRERWETVRLVVTPRTLILNRNGIPVSVSTLREGMIVDASFSTMMTRSIPPQSNAYVIRIVRNQHRRM